MFDVTASNSAANREPPPSVVGSSPPAWRLGRTVTRRSVDVAGRKCGLGVTGRRYGRTRGVVPGDRRRHRPAGRRRRRREPARCVVRDRVATPPRDVWPALHRLVRRVVAARPDDADAARALRRQLRGADRRRQGHGVAAAPAGVAVLRAARAGRRADRAADRARTDAPRAASSPSAGRAPARDVDRRDGAAAVGRRRGRRDLQRPAAARPARQRRPARPRRRRARRAAVRLRRRRLPDGVRVVVGDRGRRRTGRCGGRRRRSSSAPG